MNNLLLPINDYVFKKIFSENMDILTAFLQSILTIPEDDYASLQVIDPFMRPERIQEKASILDIKIQTKSGRMIDIEIQVNNHLSFFQRIQYYLARLYSVQLKESEKYRQLNQVISVIITNFSLFQDHLSMHCFKFFDQEAQLVYPNSMEMNFLELSKIKQTSQNKKYYNWIKFLSCRKEEEFMEIAQMNPAINKACGILKQLSADEEERLIAESREKALRDIDAIYDTAIIKGHEQGMKKGLQEGLQQGLEQGEIQGAEKKTYEVISNMLRQQFSFETIATILDLNLAEVEKIVAQIQAQ